MNQDGVSVVFEVILEEIAAVENQLAAEGSLAFHERRYSDADKLSNSGKRLLEFREKLEYLRDEWTSGIDIETRQRVKVEPGYTISPHTKGPRTKIRVTLPGGRVIERPTAAQTFADVIEEMGIEAVRKLNISVSGIPLVDVKQDQKYNQAQNVAHISSLLTATRVTAQALSCKRWTVLLILPRCGSRMPHGLSRSYTTGNRA